MDSPTIGTWTLLTGHGHVLVEITRTPEARVRDISQAAGLTERTVTAILADLEQAGYITRERVGRRTRYTVHPDNPFRHKGQDGYRVGPLLRMLTAPLPGSGEGKHDHGEPGIAEGLRATVTTAGAVARADFAS